MLLPAYTLLLGLLALLGYMGLAAHLTLASPNDVVPALFQTFFPSWFAGFAFAAVAIGALVPAAVMSIGAANLFTRNFWRAYVNPAVTPAGEAQVAKITSLAVKFGALIFILFLPTQFALDLQLLGGLWILQTFPAVVFGLFTGWFRAPALLLGWAVGFFGGSALVYFDRLVTPAGTKLVPLHTFDLGGDKVTIYTGLLALAANVIVVLAANLVLARSAPQPRLTPAASRKPGASGGRPSRIARAKGPPRGGCPGAPMTDPVLQQAIPRQPPSTTRDQRGWMVAAFIAFLGVAVVGPAVTAAVEGGRALRRRTRRRLRRLGGGTIAPLRRQVAAWRR